MSTEWQIEWDADENGKVLRPDPAGIGYVMSYRWVLREHVCTHDECCAYQHSSKQQEESNGAD